MGPSSLTLSAALAVLVLACPPCLAGQAAPTRQLPPIDCPSLTRTVDRALAMGATDARPGAVPVLRAAIAGRLEAVRAGLARLRDEDREALRQSTLLLAAYAGQDAVVSGLIEDGARIDAKAALPEPGAALRTAALAVRPALARTAGRVPDSTDAIHGPALLIAADCGNRALVHTLLEHGARPTHAGTDGVDALALATLHGDAAMVADLLGYGADACPFERYAAAHRRPSQPGTPLRRSLAAIGARAGLPATLSARLTCPHPP